MGHIFKYAVLMAIPDRSRGERVNVGLIIFHEDRLEIRFSELAKVRALTGQDWTDYARELGSRLADRFPTGREAQEALAISPRIDPVFQISDLAWFSIDSPEGYERRIDELQQAMVKRQAVHNAQPKTTRINTEIARQLKNIHALAGSDETLDSHKVVRDYFVEEDLRADFAQRNGVMRVAATLDLRRTAVNIKEATLKAVVLDRAKEVMPSRVRRFGIHATSLENISQFRSHIKLLTDYSDEVFNWENQEDRRNLMRIMGSATTSRGSLL